MKTNLKLFFGLVLLGVLFAGSLSYASASTCTYISGVTQWSACANGGFSYATAVTYATTTGTCTDVDTIKSCTLATCYDPNTVFAIPALQTLGSSTLTSNIYDYFSFDVNKSDSAGNATYVSRSGDSPMSGEFSNAFSLSGSSSYVEYSPTTILQPSGQKTFSLWVKPESKTGIIFSKFKTDTSEGGYSLVIDSSNRVQFNIKSDSWVGGATQGPVYTTPLSSALPTNQWSHVAITVDTSSTTNAINLYVNGDYVGNNTTNVSGTFTNSGAPFLLGAEWYGGGGYTTPIVQVADTICAWSDCFYKGGIDDLFVVNKVLTPCQIKELAKGPGSCLPECVTQTCYDSSLPTSPKPLSAINISQTNLVAYYPFDGNANDAKGNHNLNNDYNTVTFPNSSVSTALNASAYFNGAANLSLSGNNSNLIPNGNYSVCTWYKQESNHEMQELVSGREAQYSWSGFEMQTDEYNNNIRAGELTKTPIPAYGDWKHICYTKQGTNSNMYINGVSIASSTVSTAGVNPFPNPLTIGRDNYSYGVSTYEYFKGYMDDMSIWSRGLSACEVKSLYLGTNTCLESCNNTTCYSPTDPIKPLGVTLDPADPTLDTYLNMDNNFTNNGNGYLATKRTYVKGGPGTASYVNGVDTSNATSFGLASYPNSYNYIVSSGGVNDFGRNVAASGTVSMWIKTNAINSGSSNSPRLFGASNRFECFLQWGGNKIQCDLGSNQNGSTNSMVSPNSLEVGKWYHLAVTWDTTNHIQKMWLNGEQVSTGSATIKPLAGTDMWIGRSHSIDDWGGVNGQPWNGSIDDVAFYRRALSDCEIKKLAKGANACNEACVTRYVPQDKFKLTQTAGTYAQLDGICKANYGSTWQFATMTDADEAEIMNNGNSIFPNGSYSITNTPSYAAPMTGQWCTADPWPESTKGALFTIGTYTPLPMCYADSPLSNSYVGICRNTTITSTSTPCSTGNFVVSCSVSPTSTTTGQVVTWTATSTGYVNSPTYSWANSWTSAQGGLIAGKTTRIATTSFSQIGNYYATTTASDGVSTSTFRCTGGVNGGVIISDSQATSTLMVTKTGGSGTGTVISSPAGINCGSYCSESVNTNSNVVLTEVPNSGSTFAGWSGGGCSGTATSCTVNVDANKTVNAVFNSAPVDPNLNCSVSITNPVPVSGSVNINTLTTWTATSTTGQDFSGVNKVWVVIDSNNPAPGRPLSVDAISNSVDNTFTTIGSKTIGVTVGNGAQCTGTVNIVQTGGSTREK